MANKKNKDGKSRQPLLAPNIFTNAPHFELTGNKKIIIEGSKGVLEYTDTVVRINTGEFIATVKGRGLAIKCLTPSSLVIDGFFSGIEFAV